VYWVAVVPQAWRAIGGSGGGSFARRWAVLWRHPAPELVADAAALGGFDRPNWLAGAEGVAAAEIEQPEAAASAAGSRGVGAGLAQMDLSAAAAGGSAVWVLLLYHDRSSRALPTRVIILEEGLVDVTDVAAAGANSAGGSSSSSSYPPHTLRLRLPGARGRPDAGGCTPGGSEGCGTRRFSCPG
jgi:hypothetical protein